LLGAGSERGLSTGGKRRFLASLEMTRLVSTPFYETIENDEVVKSRHSRLSGIVVVYIILIQDDSGQAGMTSKEGYSAFCRANNDKFKI
jgi:hypothetical protein